MYHIVCVNFNNIDIYIFVGYYINTVFNCFNTFNF